MQSAWSALRGLARFGRPEAPSGPVVSVLQLHGVLRKPSSGADRAARSNLYFDRVAAQVDAAFKEKGLQAVALDINCPGGAPAQCELIADYIRHKAESSSTGKVPVYAFAQDVAASGGYWLMCAADELYACNTSIVGSVGVVGSTFGAVEAMRRLGVERRLLTAGENKSMGDPFTPLTDGQRALQHELITTLHDAFIAYVRERRGAALAGKAPDNSAIFSGKVWTGGAAVAEGLVDGVGGLRQVLTQRYGVDVQLKRFGEAKAPWWQAYRGGGGTLAAGLPVGDMAAAVLDVVEERAAWGRFGL